MGLFGALVGLLVGPLGGGVGFSVDGANDHDGEAEGFGVLDGAMVGVTVGMAEEQRELRRNNNNYSIDYVYCLEQKRLLEIQSGHTKELNLELLINKVSKVTHVINSYMLTCHGLL